MACNDCLEDCFDNNKCKIIDANQIVYKSKLGDMTQLLCFLGLNTSTPLDEVLETLDQKLCELTDLTILDCFRDKANIVTEQVSINTMFMLLQTYLCNEGDKLVKVTSSDAKSGYLNDKIVLGECMSGTIVIDELTGEQKYKINLDFICIANRIPNCFEIQSQECLTVDCTNCNDQDNSCLPLPLTPVIKLDIIEGKNVLSCTNCNGNIQWYNETGVVIGTGNPYILNNHGVIKAKSLTQCGESDFSTSLKVEEFKIYNATRKTYYRRDNCGKNLCNMNCVGSEVLFTKTYSSQISQDHANSIAEDDPTFGTEGQANANSKGTCACPSCECIKPTFVNIAKIEATCNNNLIVANGSFTISGIASATRYGIVKNTTVYNGVSYADATPMGLSIAALFATSTTNSINVGSIAAETKFVVRLFNADSACYTDVVVNMNLPNCEQPQITIGQITTSCII